MQVAGDRNAAERRAHPHFPFPTSSVMAYETKLFINGRFVESSTGATFPLENPANHAKVADVHEATERDVEHAVQAAEAAQPAWEETSGRERASVILKFAQLMRENAREIAEVSGRPTPPHRTALCNLNFTLEARYSLHGCPTHVLDSPSHKFREHLRALCRAAFHLFLPTRPGLTAVLLEFQGACIPHSRRNLVEHPWVFKHDSSPAFWRRRWHHPLVCLPSPAALPFF